MLSLDAHKSKAVKDLIYSEGRLLERKLFQYFFENGPKEGCIRALAAYQNDDGGFGNGIEPDIMMPRSSGIGAETALYVMNLLDYTQGDLLTKLVGWLDRNTNNSGCIPHPPVDIQEYPHQSWWENKDIERVFSIAGYLMKLGAGMGSAEGRISAFAEQYIVPSKIEFYDHPFFIYAIYNKDFSNGQDVIGRYMTGFEAFLTENASHNPLFSPAWYHAIPYLPYEVVAKCAQDFIGRIQDDGAVLNPYPQFPKWRPIFTLDGLVLIEKYAKRYLY